jgi:phospholipase/carboxylesterase
MGTHRASPYAGASVLQCGSRLEEAIGAVILLHGRGGSAKDSITLEGELRLPGVGFLAPQVVGHTWYPNSFLAPIESNEPWLTSALEIVHALTRRCAAAGIDAKHVAIVGFSRGACLACEFIARYPQRYGALVAFTGGLFGPVGSDLHHAGKLLGTPVLLSSGDPDPYVPWKRVQETEKELTSMGANVHTQRYPDRPHSILPEELQAAQNLLEPVFRLPPDRQRRVASSLPYYRENTGLEINSLDATLAKPTACSQQKL